MKYDSLVGINSACFYSNKIFRLNLFLNRFFFNLAHFKIKRVGAMRYFVIIMQSSFFLVDYKLSYKCLLHRFSYLKQYGDFCFTNYLANVNCNGCLTW